MLVSTITPKVKNTRMGKLLITMLCFLLVLPIKVLADVAPVSAATESPPVNMQPGPLTKLFVVIAMVYIVLLSNIAINKFQTYRRQKNPATTMIIAIFTLMLAFLPLIIPSMFHIQIHSLFYQTEVNIKLVAILSSLIVSLIFALLANSRYAATTLNAFLYLALAAVAVLLPYLF